jgi:hypothetical protein
MRYTQFNFKVKAGAHGFSLTKFDGSTITV